MMLTDAEIRARAERFVECWKDAKDEKKEMQAFWIDLFGIFDVPKRKVATYFERRVGSGFADLFWREVLLVEQKGRGRDLDAAREQARGYCAHIADEDTPRYIIACDFQRFVLDDLEEGTTHRFSLPELPDRMGLFNFMQGRVIVPAKEDPVNREASAMMAKISNALAESGYARGDLGHFLTRLTYCMFADDTEIFEKGLFQNYMANATARDGSDAGMKIKRIFEALGTPAGERQRPLDRALDDFPYIDGDLFKAEIKTPELDAELRELLIKAAGFDWSKVSPAIFGNLFQGVMSDRARRDEGAHYTTEENILKVINPLFMDSLRAEYRKIQSRPKPQRRALLRQFQSKLSGLRILDPACGSGNFLIIAYREIRRLELSVIRDLHDPGRQLLDVSRLSKVNVDQFYGIEIDGVSVKIAETALWMMDHLMNRELGAAYGLTYARIPIKKHPHIVCHDALDYDWCRLLPPHRCSYVLGNPPYSGSKKQTAKGRGQIEKLVGRGKKDHLDYVTGWFIKASRYAAAGTGIGFVATNSITQGEQAGALWPLLAREKAEISFAHRPFQWGSDAPGAARVSVVIIGLSKSAPREKRLIEDAGSVSIQEYHRFISPYLIGSARRLPVVAASGSCLGGMPRMAFGAQPIDGGHYVFDDREKDEFVAGEPGAGRFFRRFVGASDLINGTRRWLLDLGDARPSEIEPLPSVRGRIEDVARWRRARARKETVKLAQTPRELGHRPRLTSDRVIVIPCTSSERREYVPIDILPASWAASNSNMVVDSGDVALFGLLTSKMHMTWLRLVGGRLESRLRYSEAVVYNTYPVPGDISGLRPHAERVLDARQEHAGQSLRNLYDPGRMPGGLVRAHRRLDGAVDRLYRKRKFETVHERMEYLLQKYADMRGPRCAPLD